LFAINTHRQTHTHTHTAMGPLIGTGSMKPWKVLILAALFEFIGSVMLGGFVSNTVSGKLLHIPISATEPLEIQLREFMLAMSSVLFGSGAWLCTATMLSLPVSTTHSVIGSLVGVGIFMAGWHSVDWRNLGAIVITWVTSPVIGALTSILLWWLLKRYVVCSKDSNGRMIFVLPFLTFITVGVLALFLLYKGLTPFKLVIPLYIAFPAAIVLSGLFSLLVWRFAVPYIKKQIDRKLFEIEQRMRQEDFEEERESDEFEDRNVSNELKDTAVETLPDQQITENSDEDVKKSKSDDDLLVMDENLDNNGTDSISHITAIQIDADASATRESITEKLTFNFLVVITSACIAVAHGANDISNASGPLTAIVLCFQTRKFPDQNSKTYLWITFITAIGLVFGLATLGYRVMRTIGNKITKLTPSRAFVSQLSTATITLTATLLGLPLSTTHIVVGCIYGLGIVDDYKNLEWKLILGIILSWAVTIPASAIMTLIVFSLSRLLL
jgi:phosphate/sulfate permease